ncbi:hypothetical protein GW17_00021521 [Ensete ventricosum]|nr:hypothetical protein GW17_00021521 [Ensete ventricosum]
MREELRDRTAKRLCWRCDEPWSRDHRYRKGRLLMVEPIEEFEPEDVDRESVEDTEEDLQLTVGAVHALASYANPQMMKIEGFLKH